MKHRHSILLPLLALAALAVTSCHNKEVPVEEVNVDSVQTAIDKAPKDTIPVAKTVRLSGKFTCEASGYNADGLLRMTSDSLIWVTITKIVELGRAELTPDSVLVYTKFNNSYFRCDYAYLRKRFGVTASFADIQGIVLDKAAHVGSTFTVPIRTSKFKTDIKLKFTHVEYPASLTYPFSIPARAKRMSMSMFE